MLAEEKNMDQVEHIEDDEHDMYIAQLKDVFEGCDTTGTRKLDRTELLALCEKLQLQDQSEYLVNELLVDTDEVIHYGLQLINEIFSVKRRLNCLPNNPWFLRVCSTSLLKKKKKPAGKGNIAHNEQFVLFPQCFLPVRRTFCCFHQIRNCHLQTLSFSKRLNFVVWEMVNTFAKSIDSSQLEPVQDRHS